MKSLIILIFLLFFSTVAQADFYQGIRQMGMGGAAIAVVNDETALLLNPIGLGRLRVPYVTLIDPEVTTSSSSVSSVQKLLLDSTNVKEIYNELGGHTDQRYFMRTQIFPSYADRNYGFGFLFRDEITANRSSSTQQLDLNYTSDWVGTLGFNKSFMGGVFKIGGAARWIDRVQYVGLLDPTTQGLNMKRVAYEGTGLAADLGLSLSSPTDWLPTLSVMIKDIGDTSFTMGHGMRNYLTTRDPQKVPMAVDVAAALFPIWTNSTRGTFTVEYDNVLVQGDFIRKFHSGIEINVADQFYFRTGYNRGYFTGGFEWNTLFFQLQLAYYGEEVGTDANPIKEERYALKTTFRF